MVSSCRRPFQTRGQAVAFCPVRERQQNRERTPFLPSDQCAPGLEWSRKLRVGSLQEQRQRSHRAPGTPNPDIDRPEVCSHSGTKRKGGVCNGTAPRICSVASRDTRLASDHPAFLDKAIKLGEIYHDVDFRVCFSYVHKCDHGGIGGRYQ
jgi:hypothetical protein